MTSLLSEELDRLIETIDARKNASPDTSYTAKLLSNGVEKCAQKVGEEAVECAIAAVSGGDEDLAGEAADLLYHLVVLLAAKGVSPDEVARVLQKRAGVSGLDEKASRTE